MYSRISALSQARKYRTCPPPYIADNPSHNKYLQQHMGICPYCSLQVMEERDNWNNLTRHIQDFFYPPSQPKNHDKVLKGQLRYIRSDMGKWHEGYFFNPPLVLVLEYPDDISGHILTAQTYHDIYLAGPEDLILSNDQTSVGDELFVECWNIYTLNIENLGPAIGQVTSDIIEAVRKLEKNAEAYPAWALMPKPFKNHDTRIYFRELETEVSSIFSLTVDRVKG